MPMFRIAQPSCDAVHTCPGIRRMCKSAMPVATSFTPNRNLARRQSRPSKR